MQTIPLKPVFENGQFITATPQAKLAILTGIYYLSIKNLLKEQLPQDLRPYIGVTRNVWDRNKGVIREVINEVVPKICKIKNIKSNQTASAHFANVNKGAEQRLKQSKQTMFSDPDGTHTGVIAVPPQHQRYNQGHSDDVARRLAIKAKGKDNGKMLFDK